MGEFCRTKLLSLGKYPPFVRVPRVRAMGKAIEWMSADGFWHKSKPEEKQWWKSQKKNNYWKRWNYWGNEDGSWACHDCDTYQKGVEDAYEGRGVNENYCRICHVHKGRSHHILMSERASSIAAGTFLPRDEAEQQERKG